MITNLKIRNFKSLKNVDLEFKKLNLFFGPNNSGKTSVMQALNMLRQYQVLDQILDGNYVQLGKYKDVVYKHDINQNIEINFTLSFDPNLDKKILSTIELMKTHIPQYDLSKLSLAVSFSSINGNNIDFTKSTLFGANDQIIFQIDQKTEEARIPDNLKNKMQLSIERLLPMPINNAALSNIFQLLRDYINQLFDNRVYYLRANRSIALRRQKIDSSLYQTIPHDVGLLGEHTIAALAYIRDKPDYSNIFNKIEKWVDEFGFDSVTPRFTDGPAYEINMVDNILGIETNIVDVGFGINQLLPIIVQSFFAPVGSLMMVEQPEIHLHPKLQVKLVDFFIDVIDSGNSLLIESHSEHLLLRLQRRIAENKIKPEDVAIYYFEPKSDGTEVIRMQPDDTGRFKEIPAGFFEEEFKEAMKHVRAIADKLKGENSGAAR